MNNKSYWIIFLILIIATFDIREHIPLFCKPIKRLNDLIEESKAFVEPKVLGVGGFGKVESMYHPKLEKEIAVKNQLLINTVLGQPCKNLTRYLI